MGTTKHTAAPAAALALGFFFSLPVSIAIDAVINTVMSLVSPAGNLRFVSAASAQPDAVATRQSEALNAYNNAVSDFESILGQRRAQVNSMNRCRTCRDRHSTSRAST